MAALASAAGLTWSKKNLDRDGVDLSLHYPGRLPKGCRYPQLDVQVKSQWDLDVSWRTFPFRLKRKNYEDLRGAPFVDFAAPRLLVVVHTPQLVADYTGTGDNFFVFRNAAYWHNLMGAEELSEGSAGKTLQIKTCNRIHSRSLIELIGRTSWEEVQ